MVKPYNPPQFPPLDLSCWQVKDKEWMAARIERWAQIETMLKGHKSSRGMTIIKQYFLKGKLPDWEKLREWDNDKGHLDLYLFLYLHPSNDKNYLIGLRDQYIKSQVIKTSDIYTGYAIFFRQGIAMASYEYSDEEVAQRLTEDVICTGENEFYFDVLMEGLDYLDEELGFYSYSIGSGEKTEKVIIESRKSTFSWDLVSMSKWLCVKKHDGS